MTARTAFLFLFGLLGGCPDETARLPNGCYYTNDGVGILKVDGTRGRLLVPGAVHEVQLSAGRDLLDPKQTYVDVFPGFYLHDEVPPESMSPPYRADTEYPLASFRFVTRPSNAPPSVFVNMEAAGEVEVKRGKQC